MDVVLGIEMRDHVAHHPGQDGIAVVPKLASQHQRLKERPENKIDGIVALIMALARALMGESSGSVYEERGLVIL